MRTKLRAPWRVRRQYNLKVVKPRITLWTQRRALFSYSRRAPPLDAIYVRRVVFLRLASRGPSGGCRARGTQARDDKDLFKQMPTPPRVVQYARTAYIQTITNFFSNLVSILYIKRSRGLS